MLHVRMQHVLRRIKCRREVPNVGDQEQQRDKHASLDDSPDLANLASEADVFP